MDGGLSFNPLSKIKSKAKDARNTAATAAMLGSLKGFMPTSKSSKGLFSSSMKGVAGPQVVQGSSMGSTLLKIIIFIISTLFVSLFTIYTLKKSLSFTKDSIIKIVLVVLILNVGLFASYILKVPVLDFLISSQINLVCFYMLLTYSTLTTLFSDGVLSALTKSFDYISNIVKDPTSIFENSGATFMPIFFFIIPSLVLLYNATQNIMAFLLVLAITVGTGAVILFPKFD